jgi:hypothetical protein
MQAANVLVNYDLPWNPMIVEQRIGRIQRLGSKYDKVCIFNIVLKGTFEEYIVGRLMEKLQMASHAIGDIESLLQASGMGEEDDENGGESFEDKILKLVLASLAGKNVEEATEKEEKSISQAKLQLETQEREIDSMLGDMDSSGADSGPKSPKLPSAINSMSSKEFVLASLKDLGATGKFDSNGLFDCEFEDKHELIRFDSELSAEPRSILYAPGTSAFDKLVRRISLTELHRVQDSDESILAKAEAVSISWAKSFGGTFVRHNVQQVTKCFSGSALVRVRATVAHDSYERLVEVLCTPDEYQIDVGKSDISEIGQIINKSDWIGVDPDLLIENSRLDAGIIEFCRFYKERLSFEIVSAGGDLRKAKKIEDDFTPRLSFVLVGLEGFVARDLQIDVEFKLGTDFIYSSHISITPSTGEIWAAPEMGNCEITHMSVPKDCLKKCDISGLKVLEHLLVASEISKRRALPEYIVKCELTGKKVLNDEVENSDLTNKLIIASMLKTSVISGKKAEPEFFTKCEFTNADILEIEVGISQASGKKYRIDEELSSIVSGKTGHKTEFIYCSETNQPLLFSEAETCELTKRVVMPGILETCEVSGKHVIPGELEKSAVSGRKALKKFFVTSSVSSARFIEDEGVKSAIGNFCIPLETQICVWSGKNYHPDDLRTCGLTGMSTHFEFVTSEDPIRLKVLTSLLNGMNRKSDGEAQKEKLLESLAKAIGNKNPKIEFTELSPNKKHLAFSAEVRTLLGLKLRYAGGLFSIADNTVVGKIPLGRRENGLWIND